MYMQQVLLLTERCSRRARRALTRLEEWWGILEAGGKEANIVYWQNNWSNHCFLWSCGRHNEFLMD
jgi:hypothetical protein